ncbi:MAG: hypothetical protein ACT4OX_02930 [Actinomycetota bacterium]
MPITNESSTSDGLADVFPGDDPTVAANAPAAGSTTRASVRTGVNVVSLAVIGVAILVLGITLEEQLPIVNGDSTVLTGSAQALVECARNDQWHGCPGVAQYGVLQHGPAAFLASKGVDAQGILVALAIISALSYVGMLAIAARFPTCGPRRRILLVATMVLGPLVAYAVSTLGEMFTTFVFVGFGAALVGRHLLPLFVLGALAAVSREPAIFPLLCFAAAGLVDDFVRDRARTIRAGAVAGGGLVMGALGAIAFNYWRYDTWRNLVQGDPIFRVKNNVVRANLAAGVWTAPGGGVLVFWLLGGVICLGVPLTALLLRRRNRVAQLAPALLLLASAVQTAGLASWFAPYGWAAWGPRLMIPTVALGACLAVALCADALSWWLDLARRHWMMTGLFVLACVVSAAASFGYALSPGSLAAFFLPDASCPDPAIYQADPDYYYHCLLQGSWKKLPPQSWYGWDQLRSFRGVVIVMGVTLFAIQVVARLHSADRSDADKGVQPAIA